MSRTLTQQLTALKHLLRQGELTTALAKAEQLQQQHPQQTALMWVLVELYQKANSLESIKQQLELLTKQSPPQPKAWIELAKLHYRLGSYQEGIRCIEHAELLNPRNPAVFSNKALLYRDTYQYQSAIFAFKKSISLGGNDFANRNNLGLVYQNIGLFELAKQEFEKSINIGRNHHQAGYNNLIQLQHYDPYCSAKYIFNLIVGWQKKYASNLKAINLITNNSLAERLLRIGLVSDGFRTHPVGQMITKILELLPNYEISLFAYSTSLNEDNITQRIKKSVQQYRTVDHLSETQLAKKIAADQIDILFDLNGHMAGSRLRTMAMKPAPILVKWVGGLINTTGLSTMDYLLSDAIETPVGVDEWYTEKLIRMPHDYVCYEAPAYTQDVYSPPAIRNGYVTLGCFNNSQKLNEVVLEQWAHIMHQLPNSKLFLKSFQFNSSTLVKNVTNTMAGFGITAERLILEGPSSHSDLLKAYNKVDIALDPWPYSGGLTTCEAMFMGVPVVTYPGPTFAGRHSATHLTNVGLGQLVANSWEEYQALVLNLANDLDNLSNIRKHLRGALLESPLCDAQSFARHFANAMRAIWQRHCEGKKPAALTLDTQGQCQFEDEEQPVILKLPNILEERPEDDFSFHIKDHIIALEHGTSLAGRFYFRDFLQKGGVNYICIDPGSAVRNVQQLQQTGLFQHFPLTVLGDGSEMELALAVEAERSTTLPFANEEDKPALVSTTTVTSHRLDDIDGLEYIDWLILDGQHDNLAILENGKQKLANALLIEVAVSFLPDHAEQVGYDSITTYLKEQGYRLLSFSQLHTVNMTEKDIEQQTANAVFIPDNDKMALLNNNQKNKLSFLLHTVYKLQYETKEILTSFDINLAASYDKAFI